MFCDPFTGICTDNGKASLGGVENFLKNSELSKAIGSVLSSVQKWITDNLVPFMIGLVTIVVAIILFVKFGDVL